MDAGDWYLTVALLLFRLVGLINGSTVASEEPHLLGTVLTEELNVEEEKAANVTSVDFRNQEASTVGHQIKGDVESSTISVLQTTSLRDIHTVTPTMDLITIIWYVATLIALISFFVVMACADTNRCFTPKPPEVEIPVPPTPAPSYRLFAPPSYESVIEKRPDSIFIIPIDDYNRREQFTDLLVANLSDVMEPVEPSANVRSESVETSGDPRRSRNSLSITV
ncbi:uncharacterized protein LOC5567703 [Aedes aegypti]|uniref:Uncharacterized protein n=1 Tax=Aedes aegypti TaxID=7159 RepID=A0A1S4FD29_AEDAE|nr:uncharacterized protein LOC5567703 [Aedes aegypti]